MAIKTDDYIAEQGLVTTEDPKVDRPIFRRPGFDGIATPQDMDEAIAQSLRDQRIEKDLSRAELAQLFGSLEAVYGRYERAVTKLHATQILHLCEILDIFPDDLLFDAAPHLWGDTPQEARDRRRITKMIQALPTETFQTISSILDAIVALQNKT